MRHYPSFENQKYDHTLDNDMIIAENKIDGQNFVARYNARTKEFIAFGSKKMIVDDIALCSECLKNRLCHVP